MSTHGRGAGPARPDPFQPPDPVTAPAPASTGRATARTAFRIGAVALAIAALGLGISVAALVAPGGRSCATTAWNAVPAAADLPEGWSLGTSQVAVSSLATSLVGPQPADGTTSRPAIYVMVSCYDADAATALDRSRAAARAAGDTVADRPDLGDAGFEVQDASGATTALYFRRGGLVAYATPSGTVDSDALDGAASAVAAAVDRATSGATPAPVSAAAPSAEPASSGEALPSDVAGASPSPDASPVAPELQALLPTEVAGTALASDSAIGTDVLGSDTPSRAMIAALKTIDRTPADLHVAQAQDSAGNLDLYLLAFSAPGTPAAVLRPIIINAWLSGSAPGVTVSTVTVGGRQLTKVSYGDGGPTSYVYATGEAVIVIETADEALAGTVAKLLP